ncbi:MAG: glycosyltransferase family 39 protein [Deltaproteobacteria bacterium]|nr:glycosyltransferase family 39 protein [Deltaproteobacteria bacterium]
MSAPSTGERPTRWMIVLVIAVATIGGGLTRTCEVLRNPSPLYLWDDAVIHLEAQYLVSMVDALRTARDQRREERATGKDVFRVEDAVERFRREAAGVPPTFGRPLHDLAALVTMEALRGRAIAGSTWGPLGDPRLWAVPLTSAIAGALTIPLAFLVARRLWGPETGLRAAAILAMSGAHLLYSMEGFSEALLILLLYLALWVHLRGRAAVAARPDRPLAGSLGLGLVLGAGMLVHFRFSILAAVFLVADALRAGTASAPTEAAPGNAPAARTPVRLARLFWVGVGIAAMLALAELPYYLLLMAAKQRGIAVHPKTYLEQVLFVLAPEGLGYAGSLVRFRLGNLLTYPFALVYLCGGVVAVLAVLGLRHSRSASGSAEPRRPGVLLVAALFALPLAFYSLTIPLLRYGATSFALAPLFAGRAIEVIESRFAERGRLAVARWTGAALMAAALVEGGLLPLSRLVVPNGYAVALEHIVTRAPSTSAASPHLTTTPPISWALAGTGSTIPIPRNESAVSAGREAVALGARWLVVDSLVDFMDIDGQGFPAEARFLRGVEEACRSTSPVPNPFGASLVHDLELNYRPFLDTLALHRDAAARRADLIRLYPLRPCVGAPFVPPPSPVAPPGPRP